MPSNRRMKSAVPAGYTLGNDTARPGAMPLICVQQNWGVFAARGW